MSALLPWMWLLPLPGLILTAVGAGKRPGVASLAGPPLLLVGALLALAGGPGDVVLPGWLPFLPDGAFALHLDALAAFMLAALGLVSSMIYVYSLGYMHGDPGQRRFFVFLDFFVLSMALLVVAGNLAVLLIGWAGVGVASFLLIAFWRDRPGTLRAGLEALAANAVGDAALLLAIALVPAGCGSLITLQTPACTAGVGGAGLLAWLLFIAAAAKSAQGPLYFWLPSAMAGPTPVSALLHSATMVAAGVYLLVRVSPLLALAPGVLAVIAWVGVLTAIGGGILGLFQGNLKRGIAYSTVSQLGYMFAAVGLSAPLAAFFHLLSQAMFKALLFLSAGVVIHALSGEERLGHMGGLRRALPAAYAAFLIGALSLMGLPGTAGAFSKDLIVETGLEHNPPIGVLLMLGALITGLYIGRLFFGTFHGQASGTGGRGPADAETGQFRAEHLHEPRVMAWPLWPLAAGALLVGYLEWPGGWLFGALEPVLGQVREVHFITPLGLATGALGLAGFLLAGWWVRMRGVGEEGLEGAGWVNRVASGGSLVSRRLAGLHSGYLARYAFASVLGIAMLLYVGLRT